MFNILFSLDLVNSIEHEVPVVAIKRMVGNSDKTDMMPWLPQRHQQESSKWDRGIHQTFGLLNV
jgi:hypothetical protein